ncbi:MAG: DUF6817 domain-containing protein [Burkholderiales bacterium]
MGISVVVDDPRVAASVQHLRRAALLRHSGRSFLEHLLCTWRILSDWRMPVAVCRAGFMHSAYATSFYPHALFQLDERAAVRGLIGREAETLVYRFCTMDRRGFWDALVAHPKSNAPMTYPDRTRGGASVRVSRETLGRLLVIESANIAEQRKTADGGPAPWMSRVFRWWEFLDARSIPLRIDVRPRLINASDVAAVEAYRLALTSPARRAARELDRAIELNPWAGEPKMLRALLSLPNGRGRALTEASAGAHLISAWSLAWDKRLSVNAWKALAQRIQTAALGRTRTQPDFASVCEVLAGKAHKPRWLTG